TGTNSTGQYIGGLVGNNTTSTISKCYATGSVIGGDGQYIGGLVGYNITSASISNCFATGSVTGSYRRLGGLLGWNDATSSVINSYSTGSVSVGPIQSGGLVGYNATGGSITNSFWDKETSGYATSAGGTGKTTAEMKTQSTFDATWDFTEGTGIWAMSSTITFGGYPTLQWTNSYATAPSSNQIATLSNLLWVAESSTRWAASYTQTADIDASATSGWDGGGWTPIGNAVTKFSGNYNGQGYIINHLSFNRPSSQYHGFFGYTLGATIQNISLQNISMTGGTGLGGDTFEGGLIGYADGTTISGCYSTGTISGHQTVGGLIGGAYSSGSLITSCYSTATVSADGSAAGGFIGRNMNGSTISKCYSSGNVSAPSTVGGFAGYNLTSTSTPVISDCYCKSTSVSGTSYSGGFISYNSGSITSCYTTATLTGSQKLYGFASYATPATTNCFWDVETDGISGNVSGATNLGAIGKTTAEMKTLATFTNAGWDFKGLGTGGIWNIGNGRNDGYPYLDWQYPDDTPLPVILSSFYGMHNEFVELYWTTQSETDNLGFNLYRSENQNGFADDEYLQINADLIPGMGTTFIPSSYSFIDEYMALEGHTYYYWLQSVSTSNELELFGPVSVEIPYQGEIITVMSEFTAVYENLNPVLNWTTECETDNLGYFVQRSEDPNGYVLSDCVQLNSDIITGMGTTSFETDYTFTDQSFVIEGHTYWYWLESLNPVGDVNVFGPVSLEIPDQGGIPNAIFETSLNPNYPNPFNPETTISFSIKENEIGSLEIYNLRGQRILKENFIAGNHQYRWNAEGLASGIYFYKLSSPTANITNKMILMK
ncbi:MAG: GLUG motif-containing protein, partial [Candidatus Cloacimonadales bacterium]|nr:GLUG motif-containing protein [Candidatus Cloacimonadales bacterium]